MTELDILIKYPYILKFYKENPLKDPTWVLSVENNGYSPVPTKIIRKIIEKRNALQEKRILLFERMDNIQETVDKLLETIVELDKEININFKKDTKLNGTQTYIEKDFYEKR